MKCRQILGLLCMITGLAAAPAVAADNGVPPAGQTINSNPAPSLSGSPVGNPPGTAVAVPAPAMPGQPSAGTAPIPPGSELTLKAAIEVALAYHPRIREAVADSSAATARIGEARSLLGPQVFGASQYLRTTENGIGNTSYYDAESAFPRMTGRNHDLPANDFSQSWNTSNNYMGGLALTQFLFDFGRRHGFVSQREFEAAAAYASEQLARLDLIFEVSQRYFQVLQAQQLIKVYRKAVEQRKFHLHEAEVKAEAGLRPQLDVYVTEAEVQRAQLHLVDARNQYADARVALDNALGLSDRAPVYQLADVLTYSPIEDHFRALLATAFAQRPDLIAMQNRARALGAEIVEYKSDYFPTVNALGGYAAMGTGLPAANNFNVGIAISWPIFNSFLTTDQIAETRFRRHAIEHGIEDLRQQVIFQVHTAFLNWQASLQRIVRAEKTLAASRAELELAEKRYEAGLTNIVELEDAQRSYTYDDAEYASALYGFSLAKAAVDQATARSLQGL